MLTAGNILFSRLEIGLFNECLNGNRRIALRHGLDVAIARFRAQRDNAEGDQLAPLEIIDIASKTSNTLIFTVYPFTLVQ